MKSYFADLHIHVGVSKAGEWIKIPSSKELIVDNIIEHAVESKGMDIIGIVDAMSPPVMSDLTNLMKVGLLTLNGGGGYRYQDRLTIFLGAEIETLEVNGKMAHTLIFLHDINTMAKFSMYMAQHIKNIRLSSQNAHMPLAKLINIAKAFDAAIIPAHAFTPHKSLYGICCGRISEMLSDKEISSITAIELGLSADSNLADRISELADFSFLTNSDAHSLQKIAREYNIMELAVPDFNEFIMACRQRGSRKISVNYGLDPKLGKYHRTLCEVCKNTADNIGAADCCPVCGSKKLIKGVLNRINNIADREKPLQSAKRPPYYYQTPLEFIPGLGRKTLEKLLNIYGTEMNIMHKAVESELLYDVGAKVAESIIAAREGRIKIAAGGGGYYGRIIKD